MLRKTLLQNLSRSPPRDCQPPEAYLSLGMRRMRDKSVRLQCIRLTRFHKFGVMWALGPSVSHASYLGSSSSCCCVARDLRSGHKKDAIWTNLHFSRHLGDSMTACSQLSWFLGTRCKVSPGWILVGLQDRLVESRASPTCSMPSRLE